MTVIYNNDGKVVIGSPDDYAYGFSGKILSDEELTNLVKDTFDLISVDERAIQSKNFSEYLTKAMADTKGLYCELQEKAFLSKLSNLFYEKYVDTKIPLTVQEGSFVPPNPEHIERKREAESAAAEQMKVQDEFCDRFAEHENRVRFLFDLHHYAKTGEVVENPEPFYHHEQHTIIA